MEPIDALRAFRDSFYRCFDQRADALFELGDALLTAEAAVPSPVHLSLEPSHRRGWGSLYAALNRGRIDEEDLRKLLARHPLDGGGEQPLVYAVDVSVWPRSDAESSPQRGYYYHPSRHSAGQPIVAGWAYQFIAQIGFVRESWTAPMDVQRVPPTHNANAVAAEQVKALLGRLRREEAIPLFVFDAGYDPVQMQQGLEGCRAQILVRLRAGRCFYADPSGPSAPTGRRRRHGRKLDCKDPSTWPEPSAEFACEDTGYGAVRVLKQGRVCTRRSRPTRVAAAAAPRRSCAGLWFWWRWRGCLEARGGASRGSCGCGGTARAGSRRIWIFCGAPTRGALIWSIPSASSSRLSDGPPLVCATLNRPTAGRGSCSPPLRNCAWPARAWRIGVCRGRGATSPAA